MYGLYTSFDSNRENGSLKLVDDEFDRLVILQRPAKEPFDRNRAAR
jgi:hypothetical protein